MSITRFQLQKAYLLTKELKATVTIPIQKTRAQMTAMLIAMAMKPVKVTVLLTIYNDCADYYDAGNQQHTVTDADARRQFGK